MRIGIDARMRGPEQGGLGRYVEQLISHLETLDPGDEFVIFLRRHQWEAYQPTNPRFHPVLADVPWYGWQEQFWLPKILSRERLDLVHFPHWNVPLGYRRPFVVTVHDLILLRYPTRAAASTLGPLTYWFKHRAFTLVLRHAGERARHVITDSDFTRRDIHQTLGVPLKKIAAIPLAPVLLPDPAGNLELQVDRFREKYGLTKPYVLYVGVAYPHKNLLGLLRAWGHFNAAGVKNYQLVLAGKKNYFYEELLRHPLWKQSPNIVYTGFVPDADLPLLYRGAALYVVPSLYEGSALPSLEAMSFGVPVVSSNRACLPEVLGNAALFADPTDPTALASAIERGLNDAALRARLATTTAELLKQYSWGQTAKKTWEVYRNSVY